MMEAAARFGGAQLSRAVREVTELERTPNLAPPERLVWRARAAAHLVLRAGYAWNADVERCLNCERLAMEAIRAVLVVLTLSALTAIDARPAAGQYRPWCVEYLGRGGTSCTFTSREQCMMTATPGTGGNCYANPWYGGQKANTAGSWGRARR
jgi:Protein of unknown function (DUF3551)